MKLPLSQESRLTTVAIALGQLLMSFNVVSLPVGYSGGQDRSSRSKQKHAPAPIRQPDQQSESDKNAEKSCASDILQQHVEIQGGAAPEIQCMRLQKDLRGPSPLIV